MTVCWGATSIPEWQEYFGRSSGFWLKVGKGKGEESDGRILTKLLLEILRYAKLLSKRLLRPHRTHPL
jgi:hypothetical protein